MANEKLPAITQEIPVGGERDVRRLGAALVGQTEAITDDLEDQRIAEEAERLRQRTL